MSHEITNVHSTVCLTGIWWGADLSTTIIELTGMKMLRQLDHSRR